METSMMEVASPVLVAVTEEGEGALVLLRPRKRRAGTKGNTYCLPLLFK